MRHRRRLEPSARGEYEITDVNRDYLERGRLRMSRSSSRGSAWLDTGTHESLHEASSFIETIETRQGLMVASPEEIAWRLGWIDDEQFQQLASRFAGNAYGQALLENLKEQRGS